MSWDVAVFRFARQLTDADDMAAEDPIPFGSLSEIRSCIDSVFANVDWSDDTWGMYDGKYGSIEFNIGDEEPVADFMMHIRSGPEIVELILKLCDQYKWQALDCATNKFLKSGPGQDAGINAWLNFVEKINKKARE